MKDFICMNREFWDGKACPCWDDEFAHCTLKEVSYYNAEGSHEPFTECVEANVLQFMKTGGLVKKIANGNLILVGFDNLVDPPGCDCGGNCSNEGEIDGSEYGTCCN